MVDGGKSANGSRTLAGVDAGTPTQAVTHPVPTVDPDHFTPRLLTLLSNALVWRESSLLRQQLDLGTNDWRILAALATLPGASATEISEFLGLNKAIISKSVNVLLARDLIVLSDDGRRGSRPMYMTPAGVEMHDRMYPISIAGEAIILEGLTDDEIAHFNETLRQMLSRLRSSTPPV